jgi:hypothetical protein
MWPPTVHSGEWKNQEIAMFKIVPLALALSILTLDAASSGPSWSPKECVVDYCAAVEHVFWVSPFEGRPPQVSITSLHGTATIQREFVVRASQDRQMHVCMRFDPFGDLEVTCLLVPRNSP